jgi:hypothetical protein
MVPCSRPRRTIALALAAALAIAGVALSACSSGDDNDKLLSQQSASRLQGSLEGVQQRVDAGDCEGAATQAAALRQQVDGLPRRVSGKLRRALADGADRLQTLIGEDCKPAAVTTTPVPAPEENPEEQGKGNGKGKAKGKEKKQGETTTPENPAQEPTDEGDLKNGTGQQDGGVETTPDTGTTP